MSITNLLLFLRKNIFKQLFILTLLNSLLIQSLFSQSQQYPYKIKYLTVDEGLSHTDANDIAQDKQGYIWIATYFGLDRYDGYTVKKYYNSNEPLNNAFNNRLRCVYPDNNGNIWLSTEGGLQCFNVRTEQYVSYKINGRPVDHIEKIFKPSSNKLFAFGDHTLRLYFIDGASVKQQLLKMPAGVAFTNFTVGADKSIYLSGNKGVWRFDNNKFSPVNITGLSEQDITCISFDNAHNLVVGSHDQLYLANKQPQAGQYMVTAHYTSPDHRDFGTAVQDKSFNYWVNAGSNLLKLDRHFNLIQTINNRTPQSSLNSNGLVKIFIDRSQCLWLCTFSGGVNYFDLNEKPFYTLRHDPEDPTSISGNYIRSVMEDGDHVWIGTTANGLNLYNLKTHNVIRQYNSYNSNLRLKSDVVTALLLDNDHNLWLGNNNGIQIISRDGQQLLKPKGSENFPTYVVETLAKDCFGNIWFGNHTDRFGVIWQDEQHNYHVKYYGEGFFILSDNSKPQLFISSTQGLKRVIVDRKGNILSTFTYRASAKPGTLSSNYTYPIAKQNDSTYWIGTIGGGLDRLSLATDGSYQVQTYGSHYGIFNDVESLEIDNAGNIWMGGNGLECFNPATNELIRYNKNDGLQGNSFKVGSSYKGADGRLYFGGISGLNFFYPDQIHRNNIPAKPILTDIVINNQRPQLGRPDSGENSVAQSISYCNKLKINYLQNNFVISFSSMDFANPLKCKYRYKLTGFDKDWKYTDGKNPTAAYSNLDYSHYNFIVQGTNDDGIWSIQQAGIDITITPPWWKSTLAKVVYGILLLSLLAGIYIYQARWYKLKQDIAVGKINEKKREEMHQHREELYQQQLMFFTNVSHEFRTPLTLILGPLETLINENKDEKLDFSYQLIFRNAKRLLNLITELMNFKKVADSVIKLYVRPLNIIPFCEHLSDEFSSIAFGKNITFRFVNNTGYDDSALTGLFDVQVLEKILFNLLNNAFKYTDPDGQIIFEIFFDLQSFHPSHQTEFKLLNTDYRADKYIYFRVADSGIGISDESIEMIFERYYRISKNHLGSGVGLSLVKSLTQLHKGDIYVYSERHIGTEIIIGIPWGEKNYGVSEIAPNEPGTSSQLEPIDKTRTEPFKMPIDPGTNTSSKKHVLIVDDNLELRLFLRQLFEKNCYIYEAENGIQGFEIASAKVPDLIISDVMMPDMNGIEFCRLIKETFETRHIPFIILSAKDALDTKIQGMESGADFYFAKPLSAELLLLTVKNIFEQRETLKQRYTNNYLAEATELVHSEKDKEFFDRLLRIIEENIQNTDLDVDFLCRHLYTSRTKLYQKIKSISDQSVGEFIRTVRLKKSIHIMTHEDISMNEVADRVGLQSNSNFSRAFKKEYGKSPMQFMQALRKNEDA